MSWSNSWIGKPDAIKAAMDRYGETLTGNSKEEFETVKPHLAGLLDQNTGGGGVVHLDANGHAYTNQDGTRVGQCSVTLRTLGVLTE